MFLGWKICGDVNFYILSGKNLSFKFYVLWFVMKMFVCYYMEIFYVFLIYNLVKYVFVDMGFS